MASQNERGLQYEPEVDYHRAWAAFSRRHHTAIFLLFSWPAVALGLFILSRFWIHQPVICVTIILVWLSLALAAVWWAGEFRCPRCRRRYAALGHKRGTTNFTRGLFDQVCSNCKLRKFEHGERRGRTTAQTLAPPSLTAKSQANEMAPVPAEAEPIAAIGTAEPHPATPEAAGPSDPESGMLELDLTETQPEVPGDAVPRKPVGVKSKGSAKRRSRKSSR